MRKVLPDLKQNYNVVCSTNKTSDNLAIICKRFYAENIMKALGVAIGNCNNNKT